MLVPSHPHQAPQRHVRSRLQQVTRHWRRAQSREDQHNSAIRDVVAWRLFTHAIANCYHAAMKLVEKRPFADPEVSARKLVELANAFEPVHDGRIYIEKINGPFLYQLKGTPAEYKVGLEHAIAKGWLVMHESGTYVRLTEAGAATVHRATTTI